MLEQDTTLVTDFSLGMNRKIDPRLLKPNTAQLIVNADVSSGKLVPLKEDLKVQNINNPKALYFKDELYEFNSDEYYCVYHNNLYTNKGFIYKNKTNFLKYNSLEDYKWYIENTSKNIIVYIAPFLRRDPILPETYHIGKWTSLGTTKDNFVLSIKASGENDYEGYYIKIGEVTFDNNHRMVVTNEKVIAYVKYEDQPFIKNKPYEDYDLNAWDFVEYDQPFIDGVMTIIGEANYCLTYYNPEYNIETPPSDIIEYNKETGAKIHIDTRDLEFDKTKWKIRIYKTTNKGVTDFTLVDELNIDSDEIIYTDTSVSLTIAGNHILDSHTNYPIPFGAKYDTMAFATRFVAVDNKVYFSMKGKPAYFPKTYYFEFENTITALGVIQTGLIVFSENESWLITGTDIANFAVYQLSKEQGCLNHNTITYLKNQLFWVSYDGICTTTGGQIEIISKQHIGYFNGIDPNLLVMQSWNEQLFLSGFEDKTLVADFRFGLRFYFINTLYKWLFTYKDILYGIVNSKLVKLFKSTNNREFEYKSPLFTDGSLLTFRYLKHFELIADKSSNTRVILKTDDNLIHIESIDKAKNEQKYDIIKYNTKARVYRDLEVTIKSKGTIYEYLFS